ncbi:hypothetical protein Zmor_014507 [Zophobas morio]|uniref:Tyr recombinase domain-containing protein n=1 Tax=Zophobas morio TaxID=2755281 RepID=A0AA38MGX1_9CUCU|nr:hypothetical protein Zmor_014507 [Zophobas morio]
MSSIELSEVPDEIQNIASKTREELLPNKSKILYENAYKTYRLWYTKNKVIKTTEDCLLAYFNSELVSFKSSSLWTKYSMLRSTINLQEGIDISRFSGLILYLKRKGEGHKPKKSSSLTKEHVDIFLTQADDKEHLLNKVILIFGVAGATRRQELVSLKTTCVEYHEIHFLIKLVKQKQKLRDPCRSSKTPHNRLFVNYVKGKCTVQPVGVHKIAGVPNVVDRFLNLENPSAYTSHCFRRTSASILANAGTSMEGIKRHGGWRLSAVAEGYIHQSESSKINVASTILGTMEESIRDSVINSRNKEITENASSSRFSIINNTNCVININHYCNKNN